MALSQRNAFMVSTDEVRVAIAKPFRRIPMPNEIQQIDASRLAPNSHGLSLPLLGAVTLIPNSSQSNQQYTSVAFLFRAHSLERFRWIVSLLQSREYTIEALQKYFVEEPYRLVIVKERSIPFEAH